MIYKCSAMIGMGLLATGLAHGAPSAASATSDDAYSNPLKFGSVVFYPSTALRLGYDDNVTMAASNPVRSSTRVLNAGLVADYQQQADRYTLAYNGSFIHYQSSPLDDIDNHLLALRGANFLDARHALNWLLTYEDGYDPRGSTDRHRSGDAALLAQREPDHFTRQRLGGTYRYGAEGARGSIELDAFQSAKHYRNNRDKTLTADVDSRELGFRFLYRVMPKTQLVLELRDANYDYLSENAGLDSTERCYLIGANWTATAATTGSFRVGRMAHDYREFRSDYSGLTWEAAINWKPLTYSRFDFTAMRSVSDPVSTLVDTNFVLTSAVGVKWTHEWKYYLRSTLSWNYLLSDYDDQKSANPRKDKVNMYHAGVYYDFRRWMSLGLEFSHGRRDSNYPAYDYLRQKSMAVLEVKF